MVSSLLAGAMGGAGINIVISAVDNTADTVTS